VDGYAVHAVIIGGEIIRHVSGDGIDRRVDG